MVCKVSFQEQSKGCVCGVHDDGNSTKEERSQALKNAIELYEKACIFSAQQTRLK